MGRNSSCVKQKLRKGLWSPEEDEKLYNYITSFGVGCWSSVPKLAGLQRCGKSCRLRWINYLRPDLKRGMFSQEEEDLIISLHEALGNRWAQIAAQLPGRTDNEIKNFWNSSLKKKLLKKGIDPNTHKPVIQTEPKDDHKDSTDHIISSSLQTLQTKGLPNLSTSATEFHQMNKQIYDPLFLSEFQANIDIPDYQSASFLSQLRPYHDSNQAINPACGFNSMPNLTNFDHIIDTADYVSSSDNSGSRMSKYVMNEVKESSSSNGNNQSCRIDHMDNGVDNEGPFFWEPENKLDCSVFQLHNQTSEDYSIYPMTTSNLDCFQQM